VVRAAALLTLLTALALYYAFAEDLFELSVWADVAWLAFVVLPAAFLLVWLALPLRVAPQAVLAAAAIGLGLVTVGLSAAGLDVAANFTKFAAVVAAGWWFLTFFEALSWLLLIALLIVPVDIVSVARGPTKEIVENQPHVFDALSISFPITGEHNTAQLGLPVAPTWVAMALSFGATLALAVGFDVAGLPALPLLSIALVLVNADYFWRAVRRQPS
jgi:hypothetical protein